jgi:hypothetical protein
MNRQNLISRLVALKLQSGGKAFCFCLAGVTTPPRRQSPAPNPKG